MALPLPKVVADTKPGGGLITSMGGMNSLANDMLLRKINEAKAKYAPLTTQAEAASKLAYANLMGPQFLAKLMGNDSFLGNTPDEKLNAMRELVTRAGMGQGQGNALMSQQQPYLGVGQPSSKSFSDRLKNAFNALIGQDQKPVNQNPFAQMPQQGPATPMGNPNAHRPKDGVTLEGEQWYNSSGEPVYEEDVVSPNPNAMQLELTAGQKAPQERTYAEKTGDFKGVVEEGKEAGKIRAKEREDLDNQYQQAIQSEVPLKHLNKIVTNPVFQNMRKFPWFQKLQLDSKSKLGTTEEQKLIGDFQSTALRAVAETVMGFKGRILDKEVTLANDMKVSPHDTMGVIFGKLPSIEAFNEMTKQRTRIASKIMRDQHVSKGDALEMADREVDGEKIRQKIEQELNPISDEDIDETARANNMTREQVIQRLRKEGRYNG